MTLKYLAVALGICVSQGVFSQTEKSTTQLPLFTPFNYAETAPDGYIVQGTICNHASGIGDTGCHPVTFVIDPPNNRMLMDLGAGGGQYYVLNDASYIANTIPGQCLKVNNFTWSNQVAGYLNALSMPGSTTNKARYFGRVDDVGGCFDKVGVEMFTKLKKRNGVLTEFNFAQQFPFPGIGCSMVTGNITFDLKTLDFKSPRDPYFVMPATCNSSAADFCSTSYPPGNPCGQGL